MADPDANAGDRNLGCACSSARHVQSACCGMVWLIAPAETHIFVQESATFGKRSRSGRAAGCGAWDVHHGDSSPPVEGACDATPLVAERNGRLCRVHIVMRGDESAGSFAVRAGCCTNNASSGCCATGANSRAHCDARARQDVLADLLFVSCSCVARAGRSATTTTSCGRRSRRQPRTVLVQRR